jgi:hypothetical protein
MRTIIAGSRTVTRFKDVEDAVLYGPILPTTILSGGAKGADSLGEQWAAEYSVPLEIYPADWERYGKGAGFKRNALMASKADALIALWDGKSHGTKHMIDIATVMKLKVYVYIVKDPYINSKLPDWND